MQENGMNESYNPLNILNNFANNMTDSREFVFNLLPSVVERDRKTREKYEEVKKIIRKIPSELKQGGNIEVDEDNVNKTASDIISVLRRMSPAPYVGISQTQILMKTSFIMCISYFDYLLSDLIHWHYAIHPEALSGKEYITLNELKQCNDREEAIELIINKKADSILFGKIQSQISVFKQEFKIGVNEKLVDWNMINEAVERRNIIVHNDGYINRRYINNTGGYIPLDSEEVFKQGQRVNIDTNYYLRIYNEFYAAGVLLIENCWRKWAKTDRHNADENLMYEIDKAIFRTQWDVAEKFGAYSRNLKMDVKDVKNQINILYCEALKRKGKSELLEKEICALEVNDLSLKELAQVCALRDDRDGFYRHIRQAAIKKEIKKESFFDSYEWAILKDIRKDDDYKDRIEEAFKEIEGSI